MGGGGLADIQVHHPWLDHRQALFHRYRDHFWPLEAEHTRVFDGESGPIYSCDYTGAVSVSINGAPFSRTWWSFGGDSVTEFSPAAKTQLGTWDTKFDDDYAAWFASLPPPAPVAESGY